MCAIPSKGPRGHSDSSCCCRELQLPRTACNLEMVPMYPQVTLVFLIVEGVYKSPSSLSMADGNLCVVFPIAHHWANMQSTPISVPSFGTVPSLTETLCDAFICLALLRTETECGAPHSDESAEPPPLINTSTPHPPSYHLVDCPQRRPIWMAGLWGLREITTQASMFARMVDRRYTKSHPTTS